MHYIVDSGRGFEGAPDLDPATGLLKLPTGEALAEGTGWRTITIKAGPMSEARKRVSQRRPHRPPEEPPRPERGRRC
jgi:hypothetical protein